MFHFKLSFINPFDLLGIKPLQKSSYYTGIEEQHAVCCMTGDQWGYLLPFVLSQKDSKIDDAHIMALFETRTVNHISTTKEHLPTL